MCVLTVASEINNSLAISLLLRPHSCLSRPSLGAIRLAGRKWISRTKGCGASRGEPAVEYTQRMAMASDIITRDPETLHGTPVFRGTRVPVKALFDALESGETVEKFLDGFPTVSRELVVAALERAHELLASKS